MTSRILPSCRSIALALVLVVAATGTARAGLAAYLAVQDRPQIVLDDTAVTRHVVPLPIGHVYTTDYIDRFCGSPDVQLVPLARVRVDRNRDWYITTDVPGVQLYLISGDSCYEKLDHVALGGPDQYGLWARVPPGHPLPAALHVAIHGPAVTPVLALDVPDDLGTPLARTIDVPAGDTVENPIELRSSRRRDVSVFAFSRGKLMFGPRGRPDVVAYTGDYRGTVRPDTPLAFSLYADGNTRVTLVVIDDTTHTADRDVYATPAPDAGVLDRVLTRYSILPYLPATHEVMSEDNAALAARLFTQLDPTFFVYGIADRASCGLRAGEPVLMIDPLTVMHANGHVASCEFRSDERATDFLATKRPATLVWPDAMAPALGTHRPLSSEDTFLPGNAAEVAAYTRAKTRALACYDRTWSRLDPDHEAGMYDLVTYRGGQVQKVESYSSRIYRQVDATCHLTALEKRRDAIYRRQAKAFLRLERQRLATIAKSFPG